VRLLKTSAEDGGHLNVGPVHITEQLAFSRAQDGRFWRSTFSDYWALTKPEVNFLILITTGVGFYLGCE